MTRAVFVAALMALALSGCHSGQIVQVENDTAMSVVIEIESSRITLGPGDRRDTGYGVREGRDFGTVAVLDRDGVTLARHHYRWRDLTATDFVVFVSDVISKAEH